MADNTDDRAKMAIAIVAVVLLAGGGWVVVRHYQERAKERAFVAEVGRIAGEWTEVRVCLANRAPGEEASATDIRRRMVRRRDQSMAMDAADNRYPYVCFSRARDLISELDDLEPLEGAALPPHDAPIDEPSSAAPYGSRRLATLAGLVVRIDEELEALWDAHHGEGNLYPEHVDPPPPWDTDVLPPFPDADECLPTPIRLNLGADNPRLAFATLGDRRLALTASSPGVLNVRDGGPEGEVIANPSLDFDGEVARLRACTAGATMHVLATTESETRWLRLGEDASVLGDSARVGDDALTTALRGDDGREVYVGCDESGPSIAYAGEAGTQLWVCGVDDSCELAAPEPTGSPRLSVARLGARTLLLSYPPDSRVAVVDVYDGVQKVAPRRVVPTIDDRADPELLSDDGQFVIRLCGSELRASPAELEWLPGSA